MFLSYIFRNFLDFFIVFPSRSSLSRLDS